MARWVPEYEKPLFDLKKRISTSVKIESIELLHNAGHYVVRRGVVKVPTGPGLGVHIDADFLKKATTVTL